MNNLKILGLSIAQPFYTLFVLVGGGVLTDGLITSLPAVVVNTIAVVALATMTVGFLAAVAVGKGWKIPRVPPRLRLVAAILAGLGTFCLGLVIVESVRPVYHASGIVVDLMHVYLYTVAFIAISLAAIVVAAVIVLVSTKTPV